MKTIWLEKTGEHLPKDPFGDAGLLRPFDEQGCKGNRIPSPFPQATRSFATPNAVPVIRFRVLTQKEIATSPEKVD